MEPHDGREIARLLGLEPLEGEGGLYRRSYADDHSTAIYYLLVAPDFSAMHRLEGAEVYHHYAGAPARLTLLGPDASVERHVLGVDIRAGQRPQAAVPGGVWQGVETLGEWTLLGTTMAPGYRPEDFTLGAAHDLLAGWPEAAHDIRRLTRTQDPVPDGETSRRLGGRRQQG